MSDEQATIIIGTDSAATIRMAVALSLVPRMMPSTIRELDDLLRQGSGDARRVRQLLKRCRRLVDQAQTAIKGA